MTPEDIRSMTISDIEAYIADDEGLYWFAKDYCKAHKCTINKCIRNNIGYILKTIERTELKKNAQA